MTTQPRATTPAEPAAPETMWSRDFIAICVGQFFGFTAQGLANPIFPLYMVSQGMTESFVGFALAALLETSDRARWKLTWRQLLEGELMEGKAEGDDPVALVRQALDEACDRFAAHYGSAVAAGGAFHE